MKRFLISLNTLFVSSSFAVTLVKETQNQTHELATVKVENRFDDILKDDWHQSFNSIDEVVPMFKPTQSDKNWHFLKSQTNQNKSPNAIQSLAQNIFLPNNFIGLDKVQPFSNLFVLGDSLSDIGGLCKFTGGLTKMDYPFHNNSFTNGDVAVKVLANKLSLPQKTAWKKHSGAIMKLLDSDNLDYDLDKIIGKLFYDQDHCIDKHDENCTSNCKKINNPPRRKLPYRNNYAVGGAKASLGTDFKSKLILNGYSLERQVDLLLTDHTIKSTDLIYLGIGGNDIMAAIEEENYYFATRIINEAILAIENCINRLIKNNARHIILANAPNVAKTPRYLKSPIQSYAGKISNEYYELFENMYAKFETKYPNYFKKFDLYNCFNKMLFDFENNGINITSPCVEYKNKGLEILLLGFNPDFVSECDETSLGKSFFFDDIHPTAIVHKAVGEQLYQLAISKW